MLAGLVVTSVVMGGFAILGLVADYVWPAIVRVHNSRMAVVNKVSDDRWDDGIEWSRK